MLSPEGKIVLGLAGIGAVVGGSFLVYKAYAQQQSLANAGATISTDATSYPPRSVMVVRVNVYNTVTGTFIPKAKVTLILNGVPQKIVLTDGRGVATATLVSPLGTGTHILQVAVGGKIVGSTSFTVVLGRSVQYARGVATGTPRMMRREP